MAYSVKHMTWRLAANIIVLLGSVVVLGFVSYYSYENIGLSTRMQSEHVHRVIGDQLDIGYQVGIASQYPISSRLVPLYDDNTVSSSSYISTGVMKYFRKDYMCNLSTCDATLTWPNCHCHDFEADSAKHGACEVAAEPMKSVIHSTKVQGQSRWHFESHTAQHTCYASYMTDVVLTTNQGVGLLCTHAPQLLGIVLLVLIALWSLDSLLDLYIQMRDDPNTSTGTVNAQDPDAAYKKDCKQIHVKWIKLLVYFFLFMFFLFLAFSASRAWEDSIDLPDSTWRHAKLIVDANNEATWQDDKQWHLMRSIPWGSLVYVALVFLLCAVSTFMGYALDFGKDWNLLNHERAKLATVTDEVNPLIGTTPPNDAANNSELYASGMANKPIWNLQSFGLAPVVRPHYSVLIHNTEDVGDVSWPETTQYQQNSLYQILILLTTVLLTIVIHNSYVVDVMLWSIIFSVIAYGVVGMTLRRTHELLSATEMLFPGVAKLDTTVSNSHGYGTMFLVGVGILVKVLIGSWGVYLLFAEQQLSPAYMSEIRLKQKSDDQYELDDTAMWFGREDGMVFGTVALWFVIFVGECIADYRNSQGGGKASTPDKTGSGNSANSRTVPLNTMMHESMTPINAVVYFAMVFYSAYICISLLTLPDGFDKYRHFHQPDNVSPKFSVYEWQRNNWLYGVSEGTVH